MKEMFKFAKTKSEMLLIVSAFTLAVAAGAGEDESDEVITEVKDLLNQYRNLPE